MLKETFIVGLYGHGYWLLNHLANLGVGEEMVTGKDDCPITHRQFVYTECTSQILHALNGDISYFLERLRALPEFRYFLNVSAFQDAEKQAYLKQIVQEYGFILMNFLQTTIGLVNGADYLLEHAGEDLIILSRITYN